MKLSELKNKLNDYLIAETFKQDKNIPITKEKVIETLETHDYADLMETYTNAFEIAAEGIINGKANMNFGKTIKKEKYNSWNIFDVLSTIDFEFLKMLTYDEFNKRCQDEKAITKFEAFVVFLKVKETYPEIDENWNNARELWNNPIIETAVAEIHAKANELNLKELKTELGNNLAGLETGETSKVKNKLSK